LTEEFDPIGNDSLPAMYNYWTEQAGFTIRELTSSTVTGKTTNDTWLAMTTIRQKHTYLSFEDVETISPTYIMGSIGKRRWML